MPLILDVFHHIFSLHYSRFLFSLSFPPSFCSKVYRGSEKTNIRKKKKQWKRYRVTPDKKAIRNKSISRCGYLFLLSVAFYPSAVLTNLTGIYCRCCRCQRQRNETVRSHKACNVTLVVSACTLKTSSHCYPFPGG